MPQGVEHQPETTPQGDQALLVDKVRLRFRKGGDLRLLSHQDLIRCFERIFRRANLPVRHSRGYNPRPRLMIALSLPLGVVGLEEVAEIELTEVLPEEELQERLRRQTPRGLDILSVRRIPRKAGTQVRGLTYLLPVPAEKEAVVRTRAEHLLRSTEVWVRRDKGKPGQIPLTASTRNVSVDNGRPAPGQCGSAVNIRPFLRDMQLRPAAHGLHRDYENLHAACGLPRFDAYILEIDLWLTPTGTARPVEVLGLLDLIDLLEAGAVLVRSRLELHDDN